MNNNSSEIPQIVILQGHALENLQQKIETILGKLNHLQSQNKEDEYLTAVEFMEKTKMSRASFDEKRSNNEFRVIKKGRKVYVPASEVKRYFES